MNDGKRFVLPLLKRKNRQYDEISSDSLLPIILTGKCGPEKRKYAGNISKKIPILNQMVHDIIINGKKEKIGKLVRVKSRERNNRSIDLTKKEIQIPAKLLYSVKEAIINKRRPSVQIGFKGKWCSNQTSKTHLEQFANHFYFKEKENKKRTTTIELKNGCTLVPKSSGQTRMAIPSGQASITKNDFGRRITSWHIKNIDLSSIASDCSDKEKGKLIQMKDEKVCSVSSILLPNNNIENKPKEHKKLNLLDSCDSLEDLLCQKYS